VGIAKTTTLNREERLEWEEKWLRPNRKYRLFDHQTSPTENESGKKGQSKRKKKVREDSLLNADMALYGKKR